MKIAIFTDTYLPDVNGVATHVKTLKDGLQNFGHEVLLVRSNSSVKRHFIDENILNCPAINAKKLYKLSISSPLSLKRLHILKKWNPDIIHIHNEFGIGISGVLIAKILKKPLVYTMHTMYDSYTHYIPFHILKSILSKASHKYLLYFAKNANAITGPSEKVRNYLDSFGLNKSIDVVPNACELDSFYPNAISNEDIVNLRNSLGINRDDFVAIFCGRIAKEKNLSALISMWAKAFEGNSKFKLLLIGESPERANYERFAQHLGVGGCIVFTGNIKHDELYRYYNASQAYVTASISDTHSISMIEAMACGLPSVHLRDGSNENTYLEGINGYVFDDYQQMRSIMQMLSELDIERRKSMRLEVSSSVQEFSKDGLARYISVIYSSVEFPNKENYSIKSKFIANRKYHTINYNL